MKLLSTLLSLFVVVSCFQTLKRKKIDIVDKQAGEQPKKIFEIIGQYELPTPRFVEGLEFIDSQHLLMSSGMNGDSHIDILNIETMEIERTASLESQYFGEGVTKMNDYYYMLTYTSRVLFKFDQDLKLVERYQIPQPIREGWGMTHDERSLIVSDGSDTIFFIDPEKVEITSKIKGPSQSINELELVDELLFANQFMSNDILVMDLKGKLMHKIDMTQLLNNEHDYLKKMGRNWNVYDKMNNVLNGIAYHKESQTFFLTGKNWHYLTQVKFNF